MTRRRADAPTKRRSPKVDATTRAAILRSESSALDEGLAGDLSAALQADVSEARLHVDDAAAEVAEALQADALTIGEHIYFGRGRFAPNSEEGRRLLAHELAHVAQYLRGDLPRRSDGAPVVADPRSPTETAATSSARRVSMGRIVPDGPTQAKVVSAAVSGLSSTRTNTRVAPVLTGALLLRRESSVSALQTGRQLEELREREEYRALRRVLQSLEDIPFLDTAAGLEEVERAAQAAAHQVPIDRPVSTTIVEGVHQIREARADFESARSDVGAFLDDAVLLVIDHHLGGQSDQRRPLNVELAALKQAHVRISELTTWREGYGRLDELPDLVEGAGEEALHFRRRARSLLSSALPGSQLLSESERGVREALTGLEEDIALAAASPDAIPPPVSMAQRLARSSYQPVIQNPSEIHAITEASMGIQRLYQTVVDELWLEEPQSIPWHVQFFRNTFPHRLTADVNLWIANRLSGGRPGEIPALLADLADEIGRFLAGLRRSDFSTHLETQPECTAIEEHLTNLREIFATYPLLGVVQVFLEGFQADFEGEISRGHARQRAEEVESERTAEGESEAVGTRAGLDGELTRFREADEAYMAEAKHHAPRTPSFDEVWSDAYQILRTSALSGGDPADHAVSHGLVDYVLDDYGLLLRHDVDDTDALRRQVAGLAGNLGKVKAWLELSGDAEVVTLDLPGTLRYVQQRLAYVGDPARLTWGTHFLIGVLLGPVTSYLLFGIETLDRAMSVAPMEKGRRAAALRAAGIAARHAFRAHHESLHESLHVATRNLGTSGGVLELELEGVLNGLEFRRREFETAGTTSQREDAGAQISYLARYALLLYDQIQNLPEDEAPGHQPRRWPAAVDRLEDIDSLRDRADDESRTLSWIEARTSRDVLSSLGVRQVRVTYPLAGDGRESILPEEAFPGHTDRLVERALQDLRDRVRAQRSMVDRLRTPLVPPLSALDLDSFQRAYGRWFTFYSRSSQREQIGYQLVDQMFQGAFPLLGGMGGTGWLYRVLMVEMLLGTLPLGETCTDFPAAIDSFPRHQRVAGRFDDRGPRYEFAQSDHRPAGDTWGREDEVRALGRRETVDRPQRELQFQTTYGSETPFETAVEQGLLSPPQDDIAEVLHLEDQPPITPGISVPPDLVPENLQTFDDLSQLTDNPLHFLLEWTNEIPLGEEDVEAVVHHEHKLMDRETADYLTAVRQHWDTLKEVHHIELPDGTRLGDAMTRSEEGLEGAQPEAEPRRATASLRYLQGAATGVENAPVEGWRDDILQDKLHTFAAKRQPSADQEGEQEDETAPVAQGPSLPLRLLVRDLETYMNGFFENADPSLRPIAVYYIASQEYDADGQFLALFETDVLLSLVRKQLLIMGSLAALERMGMYGQLAAMAIRGAMVKKGINEDVATLVSLGHWYFNVREEVEDLATARRWAFMVSFLMRELAEITLDKLMDFSRWAGSKAYHRLLTGDRPRSAEQWAAFLQRETGDNPAAREAIRDSLETTIRTDLEASGSRSETDEGPVPLGSRALEALAVMEHLDPGRAGELRSELDLPQVRDIQVHVRGEGAKALKDQLRESRFFDDAELGRQGVGDAPSRPWSELQRPGHLRSVLPDHLSGIPVVRDPGLTPGKVTVKYDVDRLGFVVDVHIRMGPPDARLRESGADWKAEEVSRLREHAEALSAIDSYRGLGGWGRGMLHRFYNVFGAGRAVPGRNTFDAMLEVRKLGPIIERRTSQLAAAIAHGGESSAEAQRLRGELVSLQAQLARHQKVLDQGITGRGLREVAADYGERTALELERTRAEVDEAMGRVNTELANLTITDSRRQRLRSSFDFIARRARSADDDNLSQDQSARVALVVAARHVESVAPEERAAFLEAVTQRYLESTPARELFGEAGRLHPEVLERTMMEQVDAYLRLEGTRMQHRWARRFHIEIEDVVLRRAQPTEITAQLAMQAAGLRHDEPGEPRRGATDEERRLQGWINNKVRERGTGARYEVRTALGEVVDLTRNDHLLHNADVTAGGSPSSFLFKDASSLDAFLKHTSDVLSQTHGPDHARDVMRHILANNVVQVTFTSTTRRPARARGAREAWDETFYLIVGDGDVNSAIGRNWKTVDNRDQIGPGSVFLLPDDR